MNKNKSGSTQGVTAVVYWRGVGFTRKGLAVTRQYGLAGVYPPYGREQWRITLLLAAVFLLLAWLNPITLFGVAGVLMIGHVGAHVDDPRHVGRVRGALYVYALTMLAALALPQTPQICVYAFGWLPAVFYALNYFCAAGLAAFAQNAQAHADLPSQGRREISYMGPNGPGVYYGKIQVL